MAVVYLVQHADKEKTPGDPGLTAAGQQQAAAAARWLGQAGLASLYSSPLRRAQETAGYVAAATGLAVLTDPRLRERANWDGSCPLDQFLEEWRRSESDRDFTPVDGDSSRQAGERLRAFLADLPAGTGPVAAVTHGGVTVDLLRTLLGDDQLPAGLLGVGIPPCAITVIDDLNPTTIASTAHL